MKFIENISNQIKVKSKYFSLQIVITMLIKPGLFSVLLGISTAFKKNQIARVVKDKHKMQVMKRLLKSDQVVSRSFHLTFHMSRLDRYISYIKLNNLVQV